MGETQINFTIDEWTFLAHYKPSNEDWLMKPTTNPINYICSIVNNATVSFSKNHTVIPEMLCKSLKAACTAVFQYCKFLLKNTYEIEQ